MSSSYCISYVLLMCSIATMTVAVVKYNEDGSMSSNSGPTHILQQVFGRMKKASFYINSEPKPTSSGAAMAADLATTLLDEHNRYRRMVPSTNMQTMTWDNDLAASAQTHANQCTFQHTAASYRTFGENIWASPFSNAATAVSTWFNEVYDKSCGCNNGFKECCGHYTQVVWAETNKVGCGLASCGNVYYTNGASYLLVCHYSPSGNVLQYTADGSMASLPAFYYRQDPTPVCSDCPAGSYCNNGLCDVK